MKNVRLRNFLALFFNIAVIALTVWSVSKFFTGTGEGNMQVAGFTCFRYFTVLSNVFAALTCVIALPASLMAAIGGSDRLSHGAMLWKFAGTVAVTVTLAVVLVFLGPTMGYEAMFVGSSLYLHLVCPLLALFSFCLLEKGGKVRKEEFVLGDLTVLVYGTLYLVLVVWVKVWPDFYGFNNGGMWYISYPAMLVGGFILSAAVGALHNAFQPKTAKKR